MIADYRNAAMHIKFQIIHQVHRQGCRQVNVCWSWGFKLGQGHISQGKCCTSFFCEWSLLFGTYPAIKNDYKFYIHRLGYCSFTHTYTRQFSQSTLRTTTSTGYLKPTTLLFPHRSFDGPNLSKSPVSMSVKKPEFQGAICWKFGIFDQSTLKKLAWATNLPWKQF